MSVYSKTCVKPPLSKKLKLGFQDQLSLNVGQTKCRMLQGEHSAILSTFIKLPFIIKIFILSIFEWPFTRVLLYSHINAYLPLKYIIRMNLDLGQFALVGWGSFMQTRRLCVLIHIWTKGEVDVK